ncbi:hypothetical protein CFE70_002208 [Pyrenophora teres f. teres 0-1]|uniref:Uncharacterized protein n=2 Tax=Pyrenophora teres f. teres TaxID=97479 RepID=E3RX62_PYRTT|nr:hypothetical protein PTT_13945 [Pyrenophora teres f. teres 0-1]KAE8842780.1 hypothetical protein HRS9139_02077 [Pyrenophora teres f. teres]CAA9958697.1 hypothetical protein PTMSG1_02236 [Pyrenophora teres f. maculata]KAE8850161.1 hypothetical protein PTNB85_00577 [Pyrenophora teres f. teres]KAE8851814.1 hypothetical protein HRS9122_02101 [Pyrenophora teres f. teres]
MNKQNSIRTRAAMNKRNAKSRYRLDEKSLEEKLKGVAYEYIHNLYGWQDPDGHGFALLVCRYPFSHFVIRAIQYTEPGQKAWKVVAENRRPFFCINAALQEFTKDLEHQMGAKTSNLSVSGRSHFNEMPVDVAASILRRLWLVVFLVILLLLAYWCVKPHQTLQARLDAPA